MPHHGSADLTGTAIEFQYKPPPCQQQEQRLPRFIDCVACMWHAVCFVDCGEHAAGIQAPTHPYIRRQIRIECAEHLLI